MQTPQEIPWLQFCQLPQIKRLPLQEQIQRYNILIEEVCAMKMHYSINECAGASKTSRIVSEGFLQQEDLYYILQEDGSKIYVTIEI
jgi:hypothetical protein